MCACSFAGIQYNIFWNLKLLKVSSILHKRKLQGNYEHKLFKRNHFKECLWQSVLCVNSSGIDIAAMWVMKVSSETLPNINNLKYTTVNPASSSSSHQGLSSYCAEWENEKINSWRYKVPVQADSRKPPSSVTACRWAGLSKKWANKFNTAFPEVSRIWWS